MKKIELLDFAKNTNLNITIELINKMCEKMKNTHNINISFDGNINKDFVYEFRKALEEYDKILLGKNRYIYYQREFEWKSFDIFIDYIFNLSKEDISCILPTDPCFAICHCLIMGFVGTDLMISNELKNDI